MGYTNPLHPNRFVSLQILDACWCNRKRRPGEGRHSKACARERKRMGLKEWIGKSERMTKNAVSEEK